MAAQAAGWFAGFAEAAPGAILGATLTAIVGLLGWITVSLVNLRSDVKGLDARVTALEQGQQQINERLTRLETRVDAINTRMDAISGSVNDIYKRLNDLHVLLAERLPPPPEQNPPQRGAPRAPAMPQPQR